MKQISIFMILGLFVIINSSCDKERGNNVTVNVLYENKPIQNVKVYIRELLPIEGIENGVQTVTDISGNSVVSGLKDDMYEVWIAYPGFEEVRQRLPIRNNANVLIKTSLVPKKLPSEINKIYAFGSFNDWNYSSPVELLKNESGTWQYEFDVLENDSLFYKIFFDKPYKQFYNPDAQGLKYLPGQQPSFHSIALSNKGKFQIIFDESKFEKDETPYLNHWVEREIIGIDAQEYILFEKLLTDNYQALSIALQNINDFAGNNDNISYEELRQRFDEIYNEPDLQLILTKIDDFSENYSGEIFDLAKIELAKINLVLGQTNEGKKIAEEIDLDSFAGGEAYNIVSMNFMKLPAGFAELSRQKLLTVKGRKARFALLNKMMIIYNSIGNMEKLDATIDQVIEEFPDTELAERGEKLREKLESAE